ncbi:hypothetical protein F5Y05DRAFT_409051 [Hypoxylon sp. FL0543]|nr:hypothetical protein F5Y05DRAFT_409051 [Hypoxylon sp. FL0543]
MRSQSITLAAAGLTTSATSQSTSTISVPCLVPGGALAASLPRPSNSALLPFFNTPAVNSAQLKTDACAAVTSIASAIPASLAGDAASYQAQLSGFVGANAANFSSAYAQCAPLPASATVSGVGFSPADITDGLNLVTAFADPSCVRFAEATPAPTAAATGDAGADGGDKRKTKNAAVAGPTGAAAGAAAAVGLLGAVVLL